MSTLTIGDLSFCEAELDSNTPIQGGITVSSPYGTWSSTNSSAVSSDYYAAYFVDKQNGVITSTIVSDVKGAIAGAIAGAISDNGNKYAFSSASAHTA